MTAIARGLHLLPLLLGAAALLVPPTVRAQTATVTVIVTDEEGNPRDFADVALEGAEGNPNTFADLTDENGQFTFVGVPPGKYSATAHWQGEASDRFVVDLGPGASKQIRIPLRRLSAMEEVVEVRHDISELVDTKETSKSTQFLGEFIQKVPMVNRNIEDVVAMMPGVTRVGGSDSTEISIGGGTGAQIAYRYDGQSANNAMDGGLALQIPTAAIQSFKLISAGASARYGEQSTGVAEIVTKSGTNENDFAYEVQFRDTSFGAQGLDDMDAALQAAHELLSASGSILEQEVRAGFRLMGVDELSSRDDDNNPPPRTRVRHTVSAGGPIKRDEAFFHTTLEVLQDDFGSPFVDGMVQNDAILWTSKVTWNAWADEHSSASNRLEFTANLDSRQDDGFIGLRAQESTNNDTKATTWTLGATDTHVFKNLGVLESKLSILHDYETNRPADKRAGVGTRFQIFLPPGGPTSYFLGASNFNADQTFTTIRGEANYSKLVGARDQHTLDVGINLDQTFFESFIERGTDVNDVRVVDDTNLLSPGGAFVGRAISHGPELRTDDSAWYAGVYVSDSWEVTDNFTLQLGVRAEHQSFIGKTFLAPRVGFSLDPIGDGRTRFFGNWGIYHDRLFGNFLEFVQQPQRTWSRIHFTSPVTNDERRFSVTTIEEIYKDAQTRTRDSPSRASLAFRVPELIDTFVGADDITAPTNKDWTIGISRQLPGTIRLEVTYRANRRSHQISNEAIIRREAIGQPTERDIVYGTTGRGRFQQWSAEVSRPFAANWSMNLSYVQSHNVGPVGPPQDPIDPADVFFVETTLNNDRTHVAKLQGTTKLGKGKAAWDASVDYTWQSGLPITASLFRTTGTRVEPIGRNSLRLPSARYLNFGVSKDFQLNTSADGGGGFLPTIGIRAQVFNLLNTLNVVGALAQFEVPDGVGNPQAFPPLRPDIVPVDVDISRSLEVGFSISF